jgi:hypothetical protein
MHAELVVMAVKLGRAQTGAYEITGLHLAYRNCTLMSLSRVRGDHHFDGALLLLLVYFVVDLLSSMDANFIWIETRDQQFTKTAWSAFKLIKLKMIVVSFDVGDGT